LIKMKAVKRKGLFSLTAGCDRFNAMCRANDHARGGKKEHFWGISCIGVHPGQYYDSETGLHYNYHRYYDPGTGRYLSADPLNQFYVLYKLNKTYDSIEFARRDINTYLYTLNNPIIEIDPQGLEVFIIGRNLFIFRPWFPKPGQRYIPPRHISKVSRCPVPEPKFGPPPDVMPKGPWAKLLKELADLLGELGLGSGGIVIKYPPPEDEWI